MKLHKVIPNQLLIATGNAGKYAEIAEILKKIGIKPISLASVMLSGTSLEEPEETADSFTENAAIKARYYGQKTGLAAIADDSGLCVDDLGGLPGVMSARFAIDEFGNKNFELAAKKIFDELQTLGIKSDEMPKAKFVCSLCIFNPLSGENFNFEGEVHGNLVYPPRGEFGFGYDPIFIKSGMSQTFGEISAAKKDLISHRAEAFSKFLEFLNITKNPS